MRKIELEQLLMNAVADAIGQERVTLKSKRVRSVARVAARPATRQIRMPAMHEAAHA